MSTDKEQEDTTRMTDLGPENMAALGQFLEEALPEKTNYMLIATERGEPAEEVVTAYVANVPVGYAAEVVGRVADALSEADQDDGGEELEEAPPYAG